MTKKSFTDRIKDNDTIIHYSGYLFELERRSYLQAGAYVPEVVLEHPEAVQALHREAAWCGADVILAFQYYAHREKMKIIGREKDVEIINRKALELAKEVAAETNNLFAGNICNTNVYDPDDPSTEKEVYSIFEETVGWIADAKPDFIVAETFSFHREAEIALEVCQAANIPVVIGFALYNTRKLRDEMTAAESAKILAGKGASSVGLNCNLGPAEMIKDLKAMRDQGYDGHLLAFPVGYRTSNETPDFHGVKDDRFPLDSCCLPDGHHFPTALDGLYATRHELADFAKQAYDLGARYIGGCCGTGPVHIRAMAEALGRNPAHSKYSADLSKHYAMGNDPLLRKNNTDFAGKGFKDKVA